MTNKSGTVRYHRADFDPNADTYGWRLQFTKYGRIFFLTGPEGEAMGLTVPEPAPLVVTCNGHSIEVDADEADAWSAYWERQGEPLGGYFTRIGHAFAGLLRDARQDPKPASDEPNTHVLIGSGPHVRPITPKPQPGQDDTPGIDFDALPIGTVLWDGDDLMVRLPGGWTYSPPADETDYYPLSFFEHRKMTVVYQPAPLSPGECLRGLLAERDDADELIENPMSFARTWMALVIDAARAAREVRG